jgi:ATP-dependent DNA helicase PIF1
MLVELIHLSSLIIRDESLMTNKTSFEALDRTLWELLSMDSPQNKNKPFGGKVVVLGGDFRQILPVIEGGT